MVEHVGLAVEDDGVREEPLGSEVRSGFETFLDVAAEAVEVAGGGEFYDGEGEGGAVEVGVRGKGGGGTDLEDALGVLLGLEEVEGGAALLLRGERGGGVRGENGGVVAVVAVVVAEAREHRHCCRVHGVQLGFRVQRRKWRELR